MTFLKNLKSKDSSLPKVLFILCITLLGVFLRIQYLQKSDFVINDGGMFYTMILDLQKNGYVLPRFTSYNFSQIPYAYPPLSFYVGAVLNQFLHIDLITIFRLYPLFFNILSIPAFYLLAKEITQINRQALLATAFYSILLPSYEWLISGGGLTRSPAHTYFILAFYFYLVYLRTRKWKSLIFSIFTAALMTLHHIEYCWMLVFSMALFSLLTMKFEDCLKIGLIYLAGTAFLTSPYWGTVIAYHGISPFISAFSTGDFSLATSFGRLILMVFTRESLINYINVLSIIGLLYYLFSGKFRIALWLILIIFLDPRSAERLLIFPVTIFAALTIDQVLCPVSDSVSKNEEISEKSFGVKTRLLSGRKINFTWLLICFSILYPFFLGFIHTFEEVPSLSMVTASQLDAMKWITNNTPKDSDFVIMEINSTWSVDKVSEWFPTIAGRKSITTVQGTEWLAKSSYEDTKKINSELKECVNLGEPCLDSWTGKNQVEYSYLFLTRNDCSTKYNRLNLFETSIRTSNKFQEVFENDGVVVFKKER